MGDDTMRYDLLAQEAMRGVIPLALERAAGPEGLPGNHHFYITFATSHPSVVVPPHLLEKYPDEMTIVIKQHFWDLEVDREGFSVGLSFHGQPESIRVGYEAVIRFLDPEAQFVLQFVPSESETPSADETPLPDKDAEVVSLDAFRKR